MHIDDFYSSSIASIFLIRIDVDRLRVCAHAGIFFSASLPVSYVVVIGCKTVNVQRPIREGSFVMCSDLRKSRALSSNDFHEMTNARLLQVNDDGINHLTQFSIRMII